MTRFLGAPVTRYGLAAGLAIGVVAVASTVVFACTAVMGPLTITPTSGHAGTTVTTSAQGLKPGASYALHFTKKINGNCMSWSGVITLAKVPTDGSGSWNNVSVTIPSTATMGTHGFCGMELTPVKGQTGTSHDTFTVT